MVTAICWWIIGIVIGTVIGHYIGKMIWKLHIWIKIQKIEKVHLPKSLLDNLEKPTIEDREFCYHYNLSPVGILHLKDGFEVLILKYINSIVSTEREYRLDLLDSDNLDSDKIIQVTTHAWESEFWRDEDLTEHIAELMEKYKENQSSSINNTSCSN